MQGKDGYYIDEAFVDEAWSEMNRLLDKEMPTNNKKRVLWWWWTGILLLPILYWAFFKLNPSGDSSVATIPLALLDSFHIPLLNSGITENTALINAPGTSAAISAGNPVNNVKSNPKPGNKKLQSKPIAPLNTQLIPKSGKSNTETIPLLILQNTPLLIPQKKEQINRLVQNDKNRTSLLSTDWQLLEYPTIDSSLNANIIEPRKNPGRLKWGLMFDLFAQPANTSNGYFVGLGVEKESVLKKLNIHLGLQYGKYQLSSEWTELFKELFEMQDESMPGIFNVDPDEVELPSTLNFNVEALRLPIGLHYTLTSRCSIGLGASLEFRTFSIDGVENPQQDNITRQRAGNLPVYQLIELPDGAKVPSQFTRTWDFSFSAFAQYRVTHQLSLSLGGEIFPNAPLKGLEIISTANRFRLGAFYRFN